MPSFSEGLFTIFKGVIVGYLRVMSRIYKGRLSDGCAYIAFVIHQQRSRQQHLVRKVLMTTVMPSMTNEMIEVELEMESDADWIICQIAVR